MNWLKRFFAAESGSIMMLSAFVLTAVMGMSGLAVEIGSGYAVKVRNQRVADMAALGAALAYKAGGSSAPIATQVAQDIVLANGLPIGAIKTNASATINGAAAWQVEISTAVPVRLATVLTNSTSYNVTTSAAATLVTAGGAGCITALGTSSTAVSSTGGASIVASGCGVVTNGTVYSENTSAQVTAKSIVAAAINDASSSWGGHGITTNPTPNNISTKANAASDTIKSMTAVTAALCYVNKLNGTSDSDYAGGNTSCTTPLVTSTAPAASGSTTDVNFVSGTPTAGYAAYYNSGTATYTLPAANYTFRNVTVSGGVTVIVGNGTFRADRLDMSGNGMTFGNGSVTISTSFGFNSGSTITMGNGAHYFGTMAVTGGRTLIVGSGNFTVAGSLTEAGGSHVKVGISTADTVTIGGLVDVQGGSELCFTANCAAPTAAAGTFSVNGAITTAGGSTLIIPKAMTHVINGNFNLNGSSTLGSGLYVIAGGFTNNTGGTMTGVDVTFALGGTFTLSGGTSLDLAAPSASSTYGITDMLVLTKSTAATTIGGGSQDKYSGLFYAPKSALSLSGGSSVSTNGSGCLMVVVSTVSSSGSGALNASACSSVSSGSSGTVALIQ